jgi:hypothetical protein
MKHHTMNDPTVLEMALVGFGLQKDRIEATIAEIQSELGHDGVSRRTPSTATARERETPSKRHLSAIARKRMAAAQRKGYAALKGEKVTAKKTKSRTAAARGQKRTTPATGKRQTVKVKAAKKVNRKIVLKAAPELKGPRPKSIPKQKAEKIAAEAQKPIVEMLTMPVQVVPDTPPAQE